MLYKKYDVLLDKVYEQLELSSWVGENFTIHPAHLHYKQYYYQEWDDRDRKIHDHIYTTYYSQDQAKNANGGVWPTDFSKIRLRPGGVNYIYNIMTGYHFRPPYGIDVPKGKHFNPYNVKIFQIFRPHDYRYAPATP
jgi:ubiquinol-cytochrome c reductase cytochrome c1 subunit